MTTRKNLPVLLDDGEMIGHFPDVNNRYVEILIRAEVPAVFGLILDAFAPPTRTIRLEKDYRRTQGGVVKVLAWRVPKDISPDDLEYLRQEVETRGVK